MNGWQGFSNNEPRKPFVRLEQWRVIHVREGTDHLAGIAFGHPQIRHKRFS